MHGLPPELPPNFSQLGGNTRDERGGAFKEIKRNQSVWYELILAGTKAEHYKTAALPLS